MFLSQFHLAIKHLPGVKNEMCDWLSRTAFDHKYAMHTEELAKEAFCKMDIHLDLYMHADKLKSWQWEDYLEMFQRESLEDLYKELSTSTTAHRVCEEGQWLRQGDHLYLEGLLVVPKGKETPCLLDIHQRMGHPGVERTKYMALRNFLFDLTDKELTESGKAVLTKCSCERCKQNSQHDRGMIGYAYTLPP